ncbi:MAG: hypothetical protein QOG77_610 [Solirubrobacteraceae bacterium]|nr:hypothetical protein [Solirubrobacteraceae bacterium]
MTLGGRVRPPPHPPWQFLARAAMVVTGLVLLLVVDAHGVAFYFAWVLIGLALLGEATGTLLYWRQSRRG